MIGRIALLVSASLALPAAAQAQTLTYKVLGKHVDAGACYDAAAAKSVDARAMSHCDSAIEDPAIRPADFIATLVNRGVLKYRLNQYDSAISDFDRVLAEKPNQPEALINKGLSIVASGRSPETAVPLFNAGLARRPEASVAYFGRATAYELTANYQAAYRDYQLAQKFQPRWEAPRRALARFTVR